ncbi:insulinase family protein, partial [Desulfovibrio sp. OttesenSCG-928-O18]|nr:insulinase family protein [Desulfovibrio sp. OttesenSCG-928-O18]
GFAKVVKELHEQTLPDEVLLRGKNQMRGDYIRSRQKMSARSSEAASLAILGRSLEADKELVEKAQAVTPEELQTLARKYLVLDRAYTIKVLPE